MVSFICVLGGFRVPWLMRGGQRTTFVRQFSSPTIIGPGTPPQVEKLGGKPLCSLSRLVSPPSQYSVKIRI